MAYFSLYPDVNAEWDKFVEAETQLSNDREQSHLVKLSGTLSASLLINWHYICVDQFTLLSFGLI